MQIEKTSRIRYGILAQLAYRRLCSYLKICDADGGMLSNGAMGLVFILAVGAQHRECKSSASGER